MPNSSPSSGTVKSTVEADPTRLISALQAISHLFVSKRFLDAFQVKTVLEKRCYVGR
jgi:hypothetical protein